MDLANFDLIYLWEFRKGLGSEKILKFFGEGTKATMYSQIYSNIGQLVYNKELNNQYHSKKK